MSNGLLLLHLQLLVSLLLFVTNAGAAGSVFQDRTALLEFLQSVTNTGRLLNWSNSTTSDPCQWLGVTCSTSNPAGTMRVTSLSLSGIHLYGHLPPRFFTLLTELRHLNLSGTNLTGEIPIAIPPASKLETLDLSCNALGGPIPPALGSLTSLKVLNLQDNSLTGGIPPEIGNCTWLETFQLYDNLFDGSIPRELGQLQNLKVLRGGGNPSISGPIPPELGNCTSLVILGFAATNLSGQIPPSLGKLQNLQSLLLYQTSLTGQIPEELTNCTALQTLAMNQNRLSGPIPPNIGRLRKLRELLLWQNGLTGSIPPSIRSCTELTGIDFSNNYLSGGIPPGVGRLTQLQYFLVSLNNLTGPIPPEIGYCTELKILELDTNRLSGPVPVTIGNLRKLELLFCWENEIEGPIPPSILNCSSLKVIDFSKNRLSGPIPDSIFSLPFLERFMVLENRLTGLIPEVSDQPVTMLNRLRLSDNLLTGGIPRSLGKLKNLTFLDLKGNLLSGGIPEEIGRLGSLQSLCLNMNFLTGSIRPALGSLHSIQLLDASFNRLQGPIPPQIGQMQALEHLKLSNNMLTGTIPDDLGLCKLLLTLDLGNNNLTGHIPTALGSLVSLSISLDLHANELIGTIPDSFSDLTHLVSLDLSSNNLVGTLDVLDRMPNLNFLNISYNSFSGSIPSGDLRVSIVGNADLCVPSNSRAVQADVEPCPPCGSETGGNGTGSVKLKPTVVMAVLFGGTVLIVLGGSFLLYRRCRGFSQDDTWLWQMTWYQKCNPSISVSDVVESFNKAVPIGKGSSGSVYRAKLPDGNEIAIKEIDFRRAHANYASFTSEVYTLGSKVRHKHIVRLIGYCTNTKSALLLYDFKSNGNLEELLHDSEKKRCLDWELRYQIALGAAQGIAYLHHDCKPPILHRDIKANNILLGDSMEPYIADFGLAKVLAEEDLVYHEKIPGTTGYIAPEYSSRVKITTKSDVYSYGVVLLEILTGRRALEQDRNVVDWVHGLMRMQQQQQQLKVEALDSRLRGMPDPFIHEMLQCLGIALMCVKASPAERPSMKDVVAVLEQIKHVPEEVAHKNTSSMSLEERAHLLRREETSEGKRQVQQQQQQRTGINQKLLLQLKQTSCSSSTQQSGMSRRNLSEMESDTIIDTVTTTS